ncbi:MAG: helix-turn-helix transcriptional regulator [Clostridia bacterium]|nr:helix-turn-helix transcriptional regulator [Clostridia bacterium]
MKNQKYIKNSNELGKNLKVARIKSGLSQDIASKLTHLNRSSLSYYENGRNTPTIFTLIKLISIYNIDIDDLIISKK